MAIPLKLFTGHLLSNKVSGVTVRLRRIWRNGRQENDKGHKKAFCHKDKDLEAFVVRKYL